jgi:branched-chain amino acid transport system ATP-binding protein
MNEALLKVDGLNAWYGAAQILFGVGLEVRRGEVVALMGRNGAGKSTIQWISNSFKYKNRNN